MSEGTNEGTGEGASENPSPWGTLDEDQQGYIANKGWDGVPAMLNSYQQLESLRGVPAERLLKLPSQDAEPTEWEAVFAKLGRPENPDGYGEFELPENAPVDDNRVKAFKEKAHALGLTAKQAQEMAKWDAEFMVGQQTTMTESRQAELAAELNKLKAEWGTAFDAQMLKADAAAAEFGLEADDVAKLQQVLGRYKTGTFLASLGEKLGEASFETGDGTNRDFQPMTPAQASAQISQLRDDKAFMSRYLSGDKDAVRRMDALQAAKVAK